MNRSRHLIHLALTLLLLASGWAAAQSRFGADRFQRAPQRSQYPEWEVDQEIRNDVLTFTRIRYSSIDGNFRARWDGDYPDSDLNFSYRVQEHTSLNVDPNGLVLDLTDERLFDQPFVYLISPGRLQFSDEEADSLRRYLLNGGFMMVDDFWGREHGEHMAEQMRRVFPDREASELPLSHPIFNIVYKLDRKPQVPSINAWSRGYDIEPWHGDMTDPAPHFRGYFDDYGRLMALLCHNNDLGDGWEREGESKEYFEKFAEKWSYPIGINILVYAMTH